MTPEELTAVVQQLREGALSIRRLRNRLDREVPTIPVSVTNNLRDAAQGLDDTAADLLNAFGADLPKDAL